jgi:hypothetical protein
MPIDTALVGALHVDYLENNSTIILPISIDLFRPYLGAYGDNGSHRREKPSVSTKRQWYKPATNNGLFKI